MSFSRSLLILPLLLAACGAPYDPRLPARVAVPPSYSAYLPSAASKPYARIVAAALQAQQVNAVADYADSSDWRVALRLVRNRDAGMATPIFTLIDPAGNEQGTEEARPVRFAVWDDARSDVMRQAAADVAPRLAALLARSQAAQLRQADMQATRMRTEADTRQAAARRMDAVAPARPAPEPAAQPSASPGGRMIALLDNRPVRVALTGITGAPGNGNQALAWLLRDALRKMGEVVEDSPVGVDFTIKAKVDDVAVDAATRRIEIFWLVQNARNEEVGEIVQLNEVPAGSLDRHWGTLAATVTDEAAGAINDVILTQTGQR